MKLLSLVMIVKDEASNIRDVLRAALPFVDCWTIVDTGSTDGTQEIVRQETEGKPGQLTSATFENFSQARNLALQTDYANGAMFQLMLSGDEYLKTGEELRRALEAERDSKNDLFAIRVEMEDATVFSPRIFRTGSPWRYEGLVHEVPYNRAVDNATVQALSNVRIEHVVSDHERRYSYIWENHIPLLEKQLDENPNDERALIFLAQSYETLIGTGTLEPWEKTMFAMKAMALYKRRLDIASGTDVERNFVEMQYLDTARVAGVYTDKEMFERATELQKKDPARPETALIVVESSMKVVPATRVYELARDAVEIANKARSVNNFSPVSTKCGWKANYFAAVAASQLARKHPEYKDRVREHVHAGIEAGGPWAYFKAIEDRIAE